MICAFETGRQVLVPDSGTVFVPPHLRVLHVTAEPYFVNESLKDNLFFGYGTKDLTQEMWDRGPPAFSTRQGLSHEILCPTNLLPERGL